MARTRRRRWSLTRQFAVISLVAMTLLGFALVWVTGRVMSQQAIRDGTASAEAGMAYAAAPLPAQAFTTGPLTEQQREDVTRAISGFGSRLVELRLWSASGELLYSAQGDRTAFPDTDRLNHVVTQGETDARVLVDVQTHSADEQEGVELTVLDVYVPVTSEDTLAADDGPVGERAVIGAAEVQLDHTASALALNQAVRTVTLVAAGGLVLLWLVLFRTVYSTSQRLQATALENARLALLDSLTGLPNRRLLADRMARAVAAAEQSEGRVGLVLLDIDRFKDINDSLGHDHGDELLEQVAERLRGALRDDDVVARLGGDEFAILLPDVGSVRNAERLAHRVRALFGPPFQLGEMRLHVETSVGVACLPDHADDPSSLMRTADVAMYTAKHHRTGVAVYSSDEDHSSPSRLVLLGDLHRALEPGDDQEHGLVLHYQPKLELGTGDTIGYEALMRWQHPTRGLLSPNVFIPLAEQSGLIHELTRFALATACTQLASWREEGRETPVAVNLSAHDVASDEVVTVIEGLLAQHALPSSLLTVEITETALVSDPSRVVPVLVRLDELGVKVAIDDFGIGNTSISQLRDLPVDELKIDRLFVADLRDGGRRGAQTVVKAMVDLAHSFGMQVVAEGVEDEQTARTLRRLGVDHAQGFLYAHARPAEGLFADEPAPAPRPLDPAVAARPGRAGSAAG